MLIVEVRWPGSWIVAGSRDQDAARGATSLFYLMEARLCEAALALDLFEQASAGSRSPARAPDWELEQRELRRIQDALLARLPTNLSREDRWLEERSLYEKARRIRLHERWQAGDLPEQYVHQLPFLHARSFLSALDSIAQTVNQLIGEGWETEALSAAAKEWEAKVPNVRAVRNTVAHEGERALLRRQGRAPITLQPVDNGAVSAPGGALILDMLNNNRYGCTMADGHYGEVEVSAHSLLATRDLVQGVLDSFSWTGGERWSPSR